MYVFCAGLAAEECSLSVLRLFQTQHVIVMMVFALGSLLDIIKHRSKKDCKTGVLDEFVIATVVREVLKGTLCCNALKNKLIRVCCNFDILLFREFIYVRKTRNTQEDSRLYNSAVSA